ncbi:MAG: hypothetical protein WCI53_09945 [Bacteroidota bacterium]|jgi:hypothetical protein
MKKYNYTILIAIVIICYLTCCRKEISDIDYKVREKIIFNKELSIDLTKLKSWNNQHQQLIGDLTTFQYEKFGNSVTYSILTKEIDSNDFQIVSSLFTPNEIIVQIAFYTYDDNPSEIDTLDNQSISGASVYYIENNRMFHKLFVKQNNGELIERTSYSVEANITRMEDIVHIFINEPNINDANSFVFIRNENFNENELLYKKSYLPLKEAIYLKNYLEEHESYRQLPGEDGPGGRTCGTRCSGGYPDQICRYNGTCEDVCAANITLNTLQTNNNQLVTNFIFSKYYSLRDSLFSNNGLGDKYNLYYKALCCALIDDIDLNLSIEVAYLLPNINEAIDKTFNTNYTDTIIGTNLSIQLNTFLTQMKSINNNNDFNTILTDIQNDIDNLKSKNRLDFRNEFYEQ